ncbi:MAG: G-D-S-L family lipolytic protein [Thermoflavifilum aggregans]|nr:G-D-S-L family lipolytic protein [Thermoflavifilum aggregans]
MRFSLFILCLIQFVFVVNPVQAQVVHPPFWNEIRQFKQQDSLNPPPAHAILFVGSSSFRIWKTLSDDFPGYTVINRGFGGSTIPDVMRYADDIIFPYHPKQIVIYCGDNDAASSSSITADSIYNRFVQLYDLIRKKLPESQISFVSIKPSPSRQQLMPLMDAANRKIQQFLSKQPHADFIDVYHLMLDKKGMPRRDLFLPDMLHMNRKGYLIWIKAIQPHLIP